MKNEKCKFQIDVRRTAHETYGGLKLPTIFNLHFAIFTFNIETKNHE
jgi:hypothetical protein